MYVERPGKAQKTHGMKMGVLIRIKETYDAQKIQLEILLGGRGRITKTWRVPSGLRRSMSKQITYKREKI